MASRIYTVRNKGSGDVVRYVRANTLGAAIRAASEEIFTAGPSSTDEIYQASKAGEFEVLDALAPMQIDIDHREDGNVVLKMSRQPT